MAMLPQRKIYQVEPMPPQISDAQREKLLALDTATIGHYLEAGFMDPGITQRMSGSKIAGTAVTVRVTLPDSVMAHYALKFIRPGDVLVIDRGARSAHCLLGRGNCVRCGCSGINWAHSGRSCYRYY